MSDEPENEPEHKRWWRNSNRGDAARELYGLAQSNDKINGNRRSISKRDASCYEGFALTSFGPTGYCTSEPYTFPAGEEESEDEGPETPCIINVAKSIVQTETSKIAALSKPKTAVVTTYGSHKDRRNAVKIDRLIDAEFKSAPSWRYANMWQMTEHGFKLAHAATGSACVKVTEYPNQSKVCYDLLDTLDIGFDYDELTYGSPASFFVTTWWDPYELAAIFEDHKVAILSSTEEPPEGLTGLTQDSKRAKMVRVVEGWRITTGNTPGAYMICIKDGVDLTDERDREYDYDSPPLAIYHADRHLTSPWAHSTVTTIYYLIKTANEVTLSCATSEKRNPKTLFVYDPESIETPDTEEMRDWTPIRLKQGAQAAKNKPEVLQPLPFAHGNLEFVDWLIEKAHDVVGVPRSQAAAVREAGIPSAQGQRQMASLASDRQAENQHNYIQWVAVDISKLALRAMKRIHKRDGEFKRNWIKEGNSSQRFMRQISSDVFDDFDDNRYVLQPAAVGALKGTPADRVQTALEGVQMGYIDQKRFASILGHLDTPGEIADTDTQREWVEDQIDKWLYADEDEFAKASFYRGPMLSMNLDDATLQVLEAFFRADKDIGDDDDESHRLDFFTQFLAEADALAMRKMQSQAMAQQPPAQQPQQQPPAAA